MLSEAELNRICKSVERGAKLMVGRDHSGRQKLKLAKGPFGLFVERHECSDADLTYIRKRLLQNKALAA